MRKQIKRGERLFAVLFLFLFATVLWWELDVRDKTVASPGIPEHRWDGQATIITLSFEPQKFQKSIYSYQSRKFSSTSTSVQIDSEETESNPIVQMPFEENEVFEVMNETNSEPDPWTGIFDGSIDDISIAPYTLIELYESERVRERMCKDLTDDCQKSDDFIKRLHEGASTATNSRLHILLADALAWMKQQYRVLSADVTQKVADELNADRSYITYKGSDHVIVCLAENCQQWGEEFARRLAGGQGSRAIYVGINVDVQKLKWPCPLRVINLESSELNNMTLVMDKILRVSTLMIEKRNRWVCSDAQHPPNYFGEHNRNMGQGGIYMDEYGFLMCQIPKSGSTMLMTLLRRMLHKDDWQSQEDGLPHNPIKSGVRYMNVENNDRLMKEIYDDPSIIKAAVVRHPIPRLLSGYLDKIWKEQGYGRLPGLQDYVDQHGIPSFVDFVEFLLDRYPDPYDPDLDPHFGIQSSKCGLRDHRFDFIGSLSELGLEFKEFAESLDFWNPYVSQGWGVDEREPFGFKSFEKQVWKSETTISKYYTRDIMLKVYAYYKDDFNNFGFTLQGMLPPA